MYKSIYVILFLAAAGSVTFFGIIQPLRFILFGEDDIGMVVGNGIIMFFSVFASIILLDLATVIDEA